MIVHNDCINFLNNCKDKVFDLVIADPPYFQIYGDFDLIWQDIEEYLNWSKKWITEINRTLKDTGSFYLWGKIGFNKGYALFKLADWIENEKLFTVRNWITQRNVRGRGTKRGFMEAREELLFMTKTNQFTWNNAYTKELSKRTDVGANNKPRTNQYKRCSDVWIDIPEACHSPYQRFRLANGTNFPTVKALDLCKRIIEASSNPGDLIYVPFAGSGSELVAACELKRFCVGTEIEEIYLDTIRTRLSKIEYDPIDKSCFEKTPN